MRLKKKRGKTHPGTLPGYKSKPELDLKKIDSFSKDNGLKTPSLFSQLHSPFSNIQSKDDA